MNNMTLTNGFIKSYSEFLNSSISSADVMVSVANPEGVKAALTVISEIKGAIDISIDDLTEGSKVDYLSIYRINVNAFMASSILCGKAKQLAMDLAYECVCILNK